MLFTDNTAFDTAAQAMAAQTYSTPQDHTILNMMTYMPAAVTTAGWNAGRISSTIMRGGYYDGKQGLVSRVARNGRFSPLNKRGPAKALKSHTPRPRNFTRLSSASQVHGEGGLYTPANFMADVVGNKMFPWALGRGASSTSARTASASENISSFANKLTKNGIDVGDAPFQAGALGKFNAMYKTGRAAKLSEKRAASITNYIRSNDSVLGEFLGGDIAAGGRTEARAAADLISMTGNHTATNFMGGIRTSVHGGDFSIGRGALDYAKQGASRAERAMNAFEAVGDTHKAGIERTIFEKFSASAKGKNAWVKGFEKSQSWLKLGGDEFATNFAEKGGLRLLKSGMGKALEEGGIRAASKVGLMGASRYATGAIPVVGQALMAAQLAYDLTNMTIAGVKGVGNMARDSAVSLRGTIDKPQFGMGYRDNQVAATSRARGVQAIQNSRLNARSVLGSEAAYMHTHFS